MCKKEYEYGNVFKKIKIEEWEDGHYIVRYNNNDLGMTVTKSEAEFLKRWLPSAFLELSTIIENDIVGC